MHFFLKFYICSKPKDLKLYTELNTPKKPDEPPNQKLTIERPTMAPGPIGKAMP